MSNFQLPPDYVDVAERIREFRDKHPEGTLQQVEWHVETIGAQSFIAYTAAAYRTADDQRPAHGTAWEPFPGKTPYTRDSELMNAETSAWGRAIVAAGAADAKRVASANEVVNRATAPSVTPTAPSVTVTDAGVESVSVHFNATPVAASSDYVFTFGKHKGTALTDVDASYLQWLTKQPAKAGYEAQHAEAHVMYQTELQRREIAA